MRRLFPLIVILLLNGQRVCANELVVRHICPEGKQDQRNVYFIDLLRFVLEKTKDTDGPFRLDVCKSKMQQKRAIRCLSQGILLDIVWTMTSKAREAKILPIRIPLLKGLMGYRFLIIRAEDMKKFHAVNTLEDLKAFKAGQGHDWPDTEILRANGIKVIGSPSYDGLFAMLKRKRFDYLPRCVNEPWDELKVKKNQDLAVEPILLIRYTAPSYFFVNPQNTLLANRLEKGFRLAIQDGSFENFFRNHQINKGIFQLLKSGNRKIISLKNPLLPPETPLDQKALWYAPGHTEIPKAR